MRLHSQHQHVSVALLTWMLLLAAYVGEKVIKMCLLTKKKGTLKHCATGIIHQLQREMYDLLVSLHYKKAEDTLIRFLTDWRLNLGNVITSTTSFKSCTVNITMLNSV